MIVVWNANSCQTYGFKDLDAYKKFAIETEGQDRTVWDDQVHDLGDGGEATFENLLDLKEFKCSMT